MSAFSIRIGGRGCLAAAKIERLAIIATATGGHIAGNMEVKINGGFTLPPGVNCDTNYITTKKTTDPDRAMFNMLMKAQAVGQNVRLRITDNPAYKAFAGRCSIELVDLY